jgi:hypothetical protein
MRRSAFVVALAIVLQSAVARASDIDVMSHPHLRVRTHDAAGLSPAIRAAALATAGALLERAGIAVTWIECEPPSTPRHEACSQPLGRTDLVLRLVRVRAAPDAPRHGSGQATRVALGSAMIDPTVRGGTLATIYVNRVEHLATAGSPCDVLLGRAIAHEIGHLLLGTPTHATTGLMTGIWTRDVLTRERASDWWFTETDARTMRNAVRQRAVQEMALGFGL